MQPSIANDAPTAPSSYNIARPVIRRRGALHELRDLPVLILAIYVLVNLTTVRFIVDGASMEPTFESNQFLIVSRVNYLLGSPQRGDVVVFHYPANPTNDYIKRVIGLPGDTVEIRETWVYVNDQALDEPYIAQPCTRVACPDDSWTLAADEYFMMGDNRNRSSDSRRFGPVQRRHIVGEVLLRYWPPSDWGLVTAIGYPHP